MTPEHEALQAEILDALERLRKAEAWLDGHDDEDPRWLEALAKLQEVIRHLGVLEVLARAEGLEFPS